MNNLRLFPELSISNLIPQLQSGGAGNVIALLGGFAIVVFLVAIFMVVSMCLIFKKAGREWWEAIIPFYNLYVLTLITRQPVWIIIGFFLPVLNWITAIYLQYQLSKRFGYDIPFTIGLVLLPFIFLPILAFGNATYLASEVSENV